MTTQFEKCKNDIETAIEKYPLIARFIEIKGMLFGGFIRHIIEGIDTEEYLKEGDIDIFINTRYWKGGEHKKLVEILKEVSQTGHVNFRGNNYIPCEEQNGVFEHTTYVEINDEMSIQYGNYMLFVPYESSYVKYDIIINKGGSIMNTLEDYKMNAGHIHKWFGDEMQLDISVKMIEDIQNKVLSPYGGYATNSWYDLKRLYRAAKFYKKGYVPGPGFKKFWTQTMSELNKKYDYDIYISTKKSEPVGPVGSNMVHFNTKDLEVLTLELFLGDTTIQEIKTKYIDNE